MLYSQREEYLNMTRFIKMFFSKIRVKVRMINYYGFYEICLFHPPVGLTNH